MFNDIKRQMMAVVISMFLALVTVLCVFSYIFLKNTKDLLIDSYSHSISVFAESINKDVLRIENNSEDLALMGSLFYKAGQDATIAKDALIKIFENYEQSLGGGIWFKPYVVDKNQKRFCIYAYRNADGKVVLDESFNSEEYDYLNQGWYKQIISSVTKENNTAWSLPYKENQGSEKLMITAGSGIYDDNGNLIGISTVDWEVNDIFFEISKMKPTENSFALFADKVHDYILVSNDPYLDDTDLTGKSLSNIPWYRDNLKQVTYYTYHNKKFISYVKYLDNDMFLIISVPKMELFKNAIIHVSILSFILILISIFIAFLLYYILKRYIIRPIDKLMLIANKISKGEEALITIAKPQEFAELASTFDKMTKNIKAITKERERIDSELSIARSIQESSLPNIFPPFPDKKEFDIYASMKPAKEVGGDFYDFFFIDDENFMFLIADVSGKGVPAALFMMTVKTLISNIAQVGHSPKELIETVNRKICATNKQGLFVTMFIGIVNINTGKVTYINCGHNQPLIKTNNGEYKYMDVDSNIVIGAFGDAEFKVLESQLNAGDTIFTYTDGITEALNKNEEMYGEERLKNALNKCEEQDVTKISENIRKDIVEFTEEVPQSDDLTMLIFKYNNKTVKKIFRDMAIKENYKSFYTWLHENCEEWNLNEILVNKLDMCCEELYANITFYSYPPKTGMIEVIMSKSDKHIILRFEDEGVPYNPLEKPDPDITLPPEQRKAGGLGIFMVKEMADDIKYEHIGNRNVLTVIFNNEG